MKIKNVTRLRIATALSSCTFWFAVIVAYLQSKGLSLEKVYELVSIYSISIVIFEFPTGIIGDYFSHKLSVIAGYTLVGLALIFLSLEGTYTFCVFAMILGALGISLTSGSDIALLHKTSDNFPKDLTKMKSTNIILSLISTSLGGVIGKYFNLVTPVALTAGSYLLAAIAMTFVKAPGPNGKNNGNIFAKAKEGLQFTLTKPSILTLISFSGTISAF